MRISRVRASVAAAIVGVDAPWVYLERRVGRVGVDAPRVCLERRDGRDAGVDVDR